MNFFVGCGHACRFCYVPSAATVKQAPALAAYGIADPDLDLFQSFGSRLLFGMSLPTLRNDLARVYEPKAPAPSQRLATLQAAVAAGIPVYVALAPTPPEVDETDLAATLTEVARLRPLTVFHEPINVRAENVARIASHAAALGVPLDTAVYASRATWWDYAVGQLRLIERVAAKIGLADRLHLWPDKALGSRAAVAHQPDPTAYTAWLQRCWQRRSEWPGSTFHPVNS